MSDFKNYDLANLMHDELNKISKYKESLYKKANLTIVDSTAEGITLKDFIEMENNCYSADPTFDIRDAQDDFSNEFLNKKISQMSEEERSNIANFYNEMVLDGDAKTITGEKVDQILLYGNSNIYIVVLKAGKTIELSDACAKQRGSNAMLFGSIMKDIIEKIKAGEISKIVGEARESTSWEIIKKSLALAKLALFGYKVEMNSKEHLRPNVDDEYGPDEVYNEFEIKITKKDSGIGGAFNRLLGR